MSDSKNGTDTAAPPLPSITLSFPPDGGLKISTPNISVDQLFLAASYLTRTANQLLDREMVAAAQKAMADEAANGIVPFAAIPEDLKGGH